MYTTVLLSFVWASWAEEGGSTTVCGHQFIIHGGATMYAYGIPRINHEYQFIEWVGNGSVKNRLRAMGRRNINCAWIIGILYSLRSWCCLGLNALGLLGRMKNDQCAGVNPAVCGLLSPASLLQYPYITSIYNAWYVYLHNVWHRFWCHPRARTYVCDTLVPPIHGEYLEDILTCPQVRHHTSYKSHQ